MIAIVQPLSSEAFVKKPLICGFPKIWAYFASARGEAKLTFCEVMMLFGVVFCASSIKGPTSLKAVFNQVRDAIAMGVWKERGSNVSEDRGFRGKSTMRHNRI